MNTSYRQRIEEDLKSFKITGEIQIKNPECDDESLVCIMSDIPNKYSLRAYESEDEFDAVKISLCQKEVSCVDDINVLYGTEEKSDYYQRTIDNKFAHSTYLQWKPIIYDEMDSQDSKSELSEDEQNDDEIPTEGEESPKDNDDKCRTETNKYEDSHTNDTTPSLDNEIDDSETETASENGDIKENNTESSTAAEDNYEHSPSEEEQNTDGQRVVDYEDEYVDEHESDAKNGDEKDLSHQTTTLHDINDDTGQKTAHPYEYNNIDDMGPSQEQNADKRKSYEATEKTDEADPSEEQITDQEISVDVSQHDHSYSKSSAPSKNEDLTRVESPSSKEMQNTHDNVMSDGLLQDKANEKREEADPSEEQNTDNNVISDGQVPDDASKKYSVEQNSALSQVIVPHETYEQKTDEVRRKSEKIHLVIEQLGMSTETEATIENFELSRSAMSQSLGSLAEEDESSFHSVDDETILSTLYSGANDNMSEQNDGKL